MCPGAGGWEVGRLSQTRTESTASMAEPLHLTLSNFYFKKKKKSSCSTLLGFGPNTNFSKLHKNIKDENRKTFLRGPHGLVPKRIHTQVRKQNSLLFGTPGWSRGVGAQR